MRGTSRSAVGPIANELTADPELQPSNNVIDSDSLEVEKCLYHASLNFDSM